MSNKAYKMKQLRRAMQLFAQTVTDEATMMEMADVYPKWTSNSKTYKTGEIVAYGKNADGETQLYTVLQDHTSQADWTPNTAVSLYKAVGFTESGVAIWTQPLGATDAYMKGDVVEFDGKLWVSDVDSNVWQPGVYGWTEKTE
jgi:hypothetical protein